MSGKKNKSQPVLFDAPEDAAFLDPAWRKEWVGMPEFTQDDITSWHRVIVHFRNADDLRRFGEVIGQRIGYKPLALWYPQAEIEHAVNKKWIVASESVVCSACTRYFVGDKVCARDSAESLSDRLFAECECPSCQGFCTCER